MAMMTLQRAKTKAADVKTHKCPMAVEQVSLEKLFTEGK